MIVAKEERKQLYRTDIKEYKRLKRIEWYDDNQEWRRAEQRRIYKEEATMPKDKKAKWIWQSLLEQRKTLR